MDKARLIKNLTLALMALIHLEHYNWLYLLVMSLSCEWAFFCKDKQLKIIYTVKQRFQFGSNKINKINLLIYHSGSILYGLLKPEREQRDSWMHARQESVK